MVGFIYFSSYLYLNLQPRYLETLREKARINFIIAKYKVSVLGIPIAMKELVMESNCVKDKDHINLTRIHTSLRLRQKIKGCRYQH